MSSASESSSSPSPVAPNAPKFGTLVPNRIFVGGISASTTEVELQALFSNYGCVKATKIISDRAGVSKGYGFVTFETEEEARRIQEEAENIVLKDRKLNIAPAIKKQPFSRVYNSGQVIPNGTIMYHNGVPYTYQNGMAFFTSPESPSYHYPQAQANQAAAYPVLYPQAIVMPAHYQYQSANATVPAHYVYAALPPTSTSTVSGSATDMYHYTTAATSGTLNPTGMQTVAYLAPNTSEYTEGSRPESTAQEQGMKGVKKPRGNGSVFESPRKNFNATRCLRGNSIPSSGGGGDALRTVKQIQGQQPHLVAKTVNGVTVMAYSTPIMVTASSSTPQSKDHPAGGDHESACGPEMGTQHPLTPPRTPITAEACDVMRKLQGLAI